MMFASTVSGGRARSALVVLLALGCSAGADEEAVDSQVQAVKTVTIDVRRSLVVTEQAILSRFSFERVLSQLASQSGVAGLTATQLFQQWWDTQNAAPGAYAGAHCDDYVSAGASTLNGYPYLCRGEAEGTQAACDPFAVGSSCAYIPIGLFNRFDLAPENGAHCGEYRIVYAKESGVSSTSDRNLVIFEAALANPHPQQGLKGCQQIVDTWADLTKQSSLSARADVLEDFYFDGQGSVGPVVHVNNFGNNPLGAGQIRTNQFSNTVSGWSLREFKLARTCTGQSCTQLKVVPVTNKNNAFGPLFAPSSTLPAATSFQSFFPSQVASLVGATATSLDIDTPDLYNTGQSQASGTTAAEMRYAVQLGTAPGALYDGIQGQLTTLGSALTPADIALRAQALSCAGCHRLNNNVALGGGLTWPASLGFTHVTERETEVVAGETRFRISDALVNALLPARQAIFEDFLNDRPRPSKGPNHPLNNWRSHG
ncbi:MAG: hypothetical protein EOO73_12180 [Myxococcales bacterium]|nr:MAG: hypothetical protein EOO73_12180 [Myxococcales bacterium]